MNEPFVNTPPNNPLQRELLDLASGEVGRVLGACWQAGLVLVYPQSR